MFVGRTTEQKQLEEIYAGSKSNLVILYGREGIGKSALIAEFIRGLRAYYYLAREATEREQLLIMEEEIRVNYPGVFKTDDLVKTDYYDFFKSVLSVSEKQQEKQVVVIDEFHYAAKNTSGFAASIAKILGDVEQFGNVMFLLCTSSVEWVENDMVKHLGLTARLISGFIKMKELSFMELGEWFPKLSVEECISINAAVGGVPKYLIQWNEKQSVQDNIKRLFLSPTAPFFHEAELILKYELRELSAYNAILNALAQGKYKLNDIYERTNFSRAKISVYLKNLIQMDLVEKVFSMDSKSHANVQKGLYRIKDNFLNFWYRFVFPNQSMISMGRKEWVYEECIQQAFPDYLGESFNQLCTEYLKLLVRYKRTLAEYTSFGSWNGKDVRLDMIAQSADGKYLIGACIWQDSKVDAALLEHYFMLADQTRLRTEEIYFFSKSGFTEDAAADCREKKNVKLVDLKDL